LRSTKDVFILKLYQIRNFSYLEDTISWGKQLHSETELPCPDLVDKIIYNGKKTSWISFLCPWLTPLILFCISYISCQKKGIKAITVKMWIKNILLNNQPEIRNTPKYCNSKRLP